MVVTHIPGKYTAHLDDVAAGVDRFFVVSVEDVEEEGNTANL